MAETRQLHLRGFLLILAGWLIAGGVSSALLGPFISHYRIIGRFILMNIPFLTLLASELLVWRYLFRCPLSSLLYTKERPYIGRSLLAAGLFLGVLVLQTLLEVSLDPDRFTLRVPDRSFLLFLPAVLILTPLQCTAEELLFRAYLADWLKQSTDRPLRISAISGTVFLLFHLLNPEIATYGGAIWIFLYYWLFGFFMMLIGLKEKSFLLPVLIHTVNNLYSLLAVNYAGGVLPSYALLEDRMADPALSTGVLTLFSLLLLLRSSVRDPH